MLKFIDNLLKKMEKNEIKNLTPTEYIVSRVEDGKYFEDAKDWLYKTYISSYKRKFDLIITIGILAIIIIFVIITSIFGVKSVKAKNGVVNLSSDFEDEYVIQKIPHYYINTEKNILRFAIEKYINVFESYEVEKVNIYELNTKLNLIKKNSSKKVYDKFEYIVRENYTNEIFSDLTRVIKITKFEFLDDDINLKDKLIKALTPQNPPKKVRVYLNSSVFKDGGKFLIKEEKRIIEIAFNYTSLQRDKDGLFGGFDFIVTSYDYIAIN